MDSKLPLISSDATRLMGLIIAPFILTTATVWLTAFLLGYDRSGLFFDTHYTLTHLPAYDPLLTHRSDVIATFALSVFFLFASGSVLLGSGLFILFIFANLLKIYVLREYLVHFDFFLIPELLRGVDWIPRIALLLVGAVVLLLLYKTFTLRLWKTRLVVAGGLLIVAAYGLSTPLATLNYLWKEGWIRQINKDPYGLVLYNGPVMSVFVYELNYHRLMNVMADAPKQPSARPEFDFRAIPAKAIKEKPNIYILMLESYLDPYYFHKVRFNTPPVRGLMASQIDGHDTSVFYTIRATPAAEFEVLCGLPNQQQYVDKVFDLLLKPDQQLNCLPRYLKTLGYNTIASHPNVPSMYNRGNAYPIMGFDHVYFSSDMDMSDKDSIWLNDRSFLEQNLETVKKQMATHQPFLNYVMTVGGHYPYQLNHKRRPMLIMTPPFEGLGSDALQLSYYTSDAVSEYLQALRTIDPNALIVIMGDHFPYVINDNDALVAWEKKHEDSNESSTLPVHHLYNLQHQTFGMILYKNHIVPEPYFEQFETAGILTDIMTGGSWCHTHHCLQQQPYMLIGPTIVDRKNPVRDYCNADKIKDISGIKDLSSQQCAEPKSLEKKYMLFYQQMLYPFFH